MAETDYSQEHLDRVKSVLQSAPGDNAVKAAAWNAYFDSDSPDTFKQHFDGVQIDKSIKAKLFDSKFNGDAAAPAPPDTASAQPPTPPASSSSLPLAAPMIPPMPLNVPKGIVQELPSVTGRIGDFLSNTGQVQGLEGTGGTVSKELQGKLAESATQPLVPLSSYVNENQPILGSRKLGKFAGGVAQAAEQMTSPAAIGGLGAAAVATGATAGTALGPILHSLFFGTAATGAATHFGKAAYQAVANGDYDEAAKEMGFASFDALGAALIGKGGKSEKSKQANAAPESTPTPELPPDTPGVTDPEKASEAIRLIRESQRGTGPSFDETGLRPQIEGEFGVPPNEPFGPSGDGSPAPPPSAQPPVPPAVAKGGGGGAAPPAAPPAPVPEAGPMETSVDASGRQVQTQTLTQPPGQPPVPPSLLDQVIDQTTGNAPRVTADASQPPVPPAAGASTNLDAVADATTGNSTPAEPGKPATPAPAAAAPGAPLPPENAKRFWSVFYPDEATPEDLQELTQQYASDPNTREIVDGVLKEHADQTGEPLAPAGQQPVPSMPVPEDQSSQVDESTTDDSGADMAPAEEDIPADDVTQPAPEQPTAAAAGPAPSVPSISVGREGSTRTIKGTKAKFRYEVVDADELKTSFDQGYNQDLQPRDTNRAGSAVRIQEKAAKLDPALLAESPLASDGAPIIGPADNHVEAGNHRIEAIRTAYKSIPARASIYKADLIDRAGEFGLDPAAIARAGKPVLVRRRIEHFEPDARRRFVEEANERSTAELSPSEKAKLDSDRLTPDIMAKFVPHEEGKIDHPENMPFIQDFLAGVVGTQGAGGLQTGDGGINKAGIDRIRNAIFAKAYGVSGSLDKMAEDPNPNVKNIVNGMLQAAPNMAAMREDMKSGVLHDLDLSKDFSDAADKFGYLRDRGIKVQDYLKQRDLMEGGISAEAKMIISSFDRFSRSGKNVAAMVQNYVKGVRAAGNPLQGGLFGPGEPPPTKTELIEAAIAVTEEEVKNAKPVKERPAEKPADTGEPIRAEQPAVSGSEADGSHATGSADQAAQAESTPDAGDPSAAEEPQRNAEQSEQSQPPAPKQSEPEGSAPAPTAREPEAAAQPPAPAKAARVDDQPPAPPKAKRGEQMQGLTPEGQAKNNQTDADKLAKQRLEAEFKSPIFQGNPPVDSGPLFTGKAESSEPKGQTDMFAPQPPKPPAAKKAESKSEPPAPPKASKKVGRPPTEAQQKEIDSLEAQKEELKSLDKAAEAARQKSEADPESDGKKTAARKAFERQSEASQRIATIETELEEAGVEGFKKNILVIVPCASSKAFVGDEALPAKDAYNSQLFKKGMQYADKYGSAVKILSAKYGFLDPEEKINSYDLSFARAADADSVVTNSKLEEQAKAADLSQYDQIVVLGGKEYTDRAFEAIKRAGFNKSIVMPFNGMQIGERLQAMNAAINPQSAAEEEGAAPVYDFASTQFNMPPELAAKVRGMAAKIPSVDLAGDGREEEPHVTVKYGLHSDSSKEVRAAVKSIGPIKIKLGKTSIFENPEFDVVKIAVESPALRELNGLISDKIEHTDTFPGYEPHVTLAYVKPGMGKKYVGMDDLAGTEVTLDQLLFSGKDGEKESIDLVSPPVKLDNSKEPVSQSRPIETINDEETGISVAIAENPSGFSAILRDNDSGQIVGGRSAMKSEADARTAADKLLGKAKEPASDQPPAPPKSATSTLNDFERGVLESIAPSNKGGTSSESILYTDAYGESPEKTNAAIAKFVRTGLVERESRDGDSFFTRTKEGTKELKEVSKNDQPPKPPAAKAAEPKASIQPPAPPKPRIEGSTAPEARPGRLRQASEDVPSPRAAGQQSGASGSSAASNGSATESSDRSDVGRDGARRAPGRVGEPGPEVKVSPSAGGPEGVRPTRKPTIITVGNPPTLDTSKVPQPKSFTLYPHQQQASAAAIKAMETGDRGFLNAGGTGSGKSSNATSVARYFLDKGKAVFLVAPAEVMKFKDTNSAMPESSYKDWFGQYDLKPIRYKKGMTIEPGKFYVSTYNGFGDATMTDDVVLIADEAHALKNFSSSARGETGVDLINKAHAVLLMSATPVDQPQHIGYLRRVGIFEGKPEAEALASLGMRLIKSKVPKKPAPGAPPPEPGAEVPTEEKYHWAVDPKVGTKAVRQRFLDVFARMIEQGKMRKQEIALDAMDIQMIKVELPPEAAEVAELIEKELSGRTDPKNISMHLRRQQEPFKIPATVEQVKKELAEGRKVVVFVNRVNRSDVTWTERVKDRYGEVVDEIEHLVHSSEGTAKALKEALAKEGIGVAEIHGGAYDSSAEGMRKFQAGERDVVIATAPSGGTGIDLDDKEGDKPRTILVLTPEFDAMSNVQLMGRIYRMSSKSDARVRYLFADTETDRWNIKKLSGKIKTLSSVVQGESSKMDIGQFFPEEKENDGPSMAGDKKSEAARKKKLPKLRGKKYGGYIEFFGSQAEKFSKATGIKITRVYGRNRTYSDVVGFPVSEIEKYGENFNIAYDDSMRGDMWYRREAASTAAEEARKAEQAKNPPAAAPPRTTPGPKFSKIVMLGDQYLGSFRRATLSKSETESIKSAMMLEGVQGNREFGMAEVFNSRGYTLRVDPKTGVGSLSKLSLQ